MSPRKLPDYNKPPLAEVVMGVRFQPLPGIKVPHYGLFWSKVKEEFPKCQNAPVLGNPVGLEEKETGGLPIPRVWLINEGGDYLIQLQRNHFLFNWRKRGGVYPRFNSIAPKFYENFKKFQDFCSENDLGDTVPQSFELSYINHIFSGEGWKNIKEIGKIFPDLMWKDDQSRYLKELVTTQWLAEFPMSNPQLGDIRVNVRHGKKQPEDLPVLVFEIIVRSDTMNGLQKIKQEKWFKSAHDDILWTFEDLTDDRVQKSFWGKKNGH
jgi:uncharacterized protein (TIGR04255 family)